MASREIYDYSPNLRINFDGALSVAVVLILIVLLVPLPTIIVDFGIALSFGLSLLVLMVALSIKRPLDFTSFPALLLIVTLLRLALNIATTRAILTNGVHGVDAAGAMIGGFSKIIMGGDFVIGIVVFLILSVINFVVITKGASRIAEVGARFTLDSIPGKQMAIDADLSAGLIAESEARQRRSELDEESTFFGAMDGASKFVKGDAISGIIILMVNLIGGILIGTLRHSMELSEATETYVRLAIGDGLVTQIPALIVSLAAGIIVSKGGSRQPIQSAIMSHLLGNPRAIHLSIAALVLLSLTPGLPFLPFALMALLGAIQVGVARRIEGQVASLNQTGSVSESEKKSDRTQSEQLRGSEFGSIVIGFGKQISVVILNSANSLEKRIEDIRLRLMKSYAIRIPQIEIKCDHQLPIKDYEICYQGIVIGRMETFPGHRLVIVGDDTELDVAGTRVEDPIYGLSAIWVPEHFAGDPRIKKYKNVDCVAVILAHFDSIMQQNIAQLFLYSDFKRMLDELNPEYKKLLEEVCPAHISKTGVHSILKSLLNERVTLQPIEMIIESIAEAAPLTRRLDVIVEHVRRRIAPYIIRDGSQDGVLNIVTLSDQWEEVLNRCARRDDRGEIIEFYLDASSIEKLQKSVLRVNEDLVQKGIKFVLVTNSECRSYIRALIERSACHIPVLSKIELLKSSRTQKVGLVE